MECSGKPDLHGVLVIDKPRGPTSMSMVNLVRRKCKKVKTGHAGTLDPLATGVLVLGVGSMTKKLSELMVTDKQYTTVINLEAMTAGHDAETPPKFVDIKKIPTQQEVASAVATFEGEINQIPPMHSAVKIDGHRAYALARKGQKIEMPPRKVEVHEIKVTAYEWPIVAISILCSKGFYVRSLARDLGIKLNTGGYCTDIRRTAVGSFTLEHAHQLESLPEWLSADDLISPHQVDLMLQG